MVEVDVDGRDSDEDRTSPVKVLTLVGVDSNGVEGENFPAGG